MDVFLEGTILGFSLAFLFGFGPAFFALIQTGIHRGFWSGLSLAAGIFLNDLIIIFIAVFGATSIFGGKENYQIMGVVGGLLLIVFGVVTFFNKIKHTETENQELELKTPHPVIFIGKGFLLNAANPFVWIFWVSIVVGLTARFAAKQSELYLFFAGALSVVFITDVIKTFAASQFKKFATHKFLVLVNKLAGIALALFGIFLIIRSVYQL